MLRLRSVQVLVCTRINTLNGGFIMKELQIKLEKILKSKRKRNKFHEGSIKNYDGSENKTFKELYTASNAEIILLISIIDYIKYNDYLFHSYIPKEDHI